MRFGAGAAIRWPGNAIDASHCPSVMVRDMGLSLCMNMDCVPRITTAANTRLCMEGGNVKNAILCKLREFALPHTAHSARNLKADTPLYERDACPLLAEVRHGPGDWVST